MVALSQDSFKVTETTSSARQEPLRGETLDLQFALQLIFL